MTWLPLLTYLFSIIVGGVLIAFGPHGPIVICIACGPIWMTVLGAISIVLGVAGLAMQGKGLSG
jgi:hypothetical protein